MQGHAAVTVPLGAGDFSACQAAGTGHLDALGPKLAGQGNRAFHGPAEGHAALQLGGDALGHELGLDLGTADLGHLDGDVLSEFLLEVVAQLLDLGALAADDDARAGGVQHQAHLAAGAFDLDLGETGVVELLLDVFTELVVLENEGRIVLLAEPAGKPVLGIPQAEPDRMYFLTHGAPYFSFTMTVMWLVRFRMR